jgi:hypothetical protein
MSRGYGTTANSYSGNSEDEIGFLLSNVNEPGDGTTPLVGSSRVVANDGKHQASALEVLNGL